MTLSKQSLEAITDLLDNRITSMHVGDRDDLRELTILKRAMAELSAIGGQGLGDMPSLAAISRRGRRKKIGDQGQMGAFA